MIKKSYQPEIKIYIKNNTISFIMLYSNNGRYNVDYEKSFIKAKYLQLSKPTKFWYINKWGYRNNITLNTLSTVLMVLYMRR